MHFKLDLSNQYLGSSFPAQRFVHRDQADL
jgi:hypothetical protein